MLKAALIATALTAVASNAMAGNIALDPGDPMANGSPCRAVQSLDLGCALRVVDTNDDGTISFAELASLASARPAIDWTLLGAPRSSGLDFRESAIQPDSALSAAPERDSSPSIFAALFALGAMVLLLRSRPA